MLLDLFGITDKILSLIAWAKDFFVHRQAVDEGKREEKLNEVTSLAIEEKKDLQDVQKANDFNARLASDPAFAASVCSTLNQPADSAK